MRRRHHFIIIASMIIISIIACQSSINPDLNPEAEVTATIEILPTIDSDSWEATYAATNDNDLLTLRPNILADPNIACTFYIDVFTTSIPLSCLDKDGWHVYKPAAFGDPNHAPLWFAQCLDGRTYVDVQSSLYILKGETLVKIGDQIGGGNYFACGPGNEIWVSLTYVDIGHYDGTTWTEYPASEFSGSGEDIQAITIAPNGNVWVATYDSIAKFDRTNWEVFEEDPMGMAIDSKGNVWVINYDGLRKYDGNQWLTFYEGSPRPTLRSIVIDKEDTVWVAGEDRYPNYSSGIYTFNSQTNSWALVFDTKALSGTEIKAMQFDQQGRLWVVTDYGLNIFDGTAWTVYQVHTADMYANTADAIVVFGDGPQLPALALKAPGAVRGKLVNPESTNFTNMQVEICVKSVVNYYETTPCASQKYHALTTMDANGNFLFTDIPAGSYYLAIQLSTSAWSMMIGNPSTPMYYGQFFVYPGAVTDLGQIKTSQD